MAFPASYAQAREEGSFPSEFSSPPPLRFSGLVPLRFFLSSLPFRALSPPRLGPRRSSLDRGRLVRSGCPGWPDVLPGDRRGREGWQRRRWDASRVCAMRWKFLRVFLSFPALVFPVLLDCPEWALSCVLRFAALALSGSLSCLFWLGDVPAGRVFGQCRALARFALGPWKGFYAHVFGSAGRFWVFLAGSGSFRSFAGFGVRALAGLLARCPVPLSLPVLGVAPWFARAGVRCLQSKSSRGFTSSHSVSRRRVAGR